MPARNSYASKLAALRKEIAIGVAELDRGEYIEIDLDDLPQFLAEIGAPKKKRRKRR